MAYNQGVGAGYNQGVRGGYNDGVGGYPTNQAATGTSGMKNSNALPSTSWLLCRCFACSWLFDSWYNNLRYVGFVVNFRLGDRFWFD